MSVRCRTLFAARIDDARQQLLFLSALCNQSPIDDAEPKENSGIVSRILALASPGRLAASSELRPDRGANTDNR